MKQTPVLSSTPHKEPVWKLALRVFPKGTTTQCPVRAFNPATLRSLAQRSKLLSYVAVVEVNRLQDVFLVAVDKLFNVMLKFSDKKHFN